MTAFVFLGPSIPISKASKLSSATFLPPINVGDLAWVIQQRPKVIGIIDGYFYSHPSVWHKEILVALNQGIHVIGGSSIGAIRALELGSFGMIGVGEVFQWFKDGKVEADDEIAYEFIYSEHGYKKVSEPLVNIRKTFKAALEDGILDSVNHDYLIKISKDLYYKDRTFDRIINQAVADQLAPDVGTSLKNFVDTQKTNILEQDAIRVLEAVERARITKEGFEPKFELSMTPFVDDILDVHKKEEIGSSRSIMSEDLTNHARLEWEDYFDTKTRAMENLILLIYADQNGISLDESELVAGRELFLEFLEIQEKDIQTWSSQNNIALHEFENYLHDWVLLKKIRSRAKEIDNRTFLWHLRLENRYSNLLKSTKLVLESEDSDKKKPIEKRFTTRELLVYFRDKLKISSIQDVFSRANELGFSSEASFLLSILRSMLRKDID